MSAAANHITEVQMKLKLSKQAKEKLEQRAISTGKEMADVASQLLEEAIREPVADSARQLAALEAFAAGMTAWTSRHLPPGHIVDDSREKIYEGRGG